MDSLSSVDNNSILLGMHSKEIHQIMCVSTDKLDHHMWQWSMLYLEVFLIVFFLIELNVSGSHFISDETLRCHLVAHVLKRKRKSLDASAHPAFA